MKIVTRKISELKPADYNPRKRSEHVLDTIKASLTDYGFLAPVVVNTHPDRKDIIIGGHRRLDAATANGETEVPTIEVSIGDIEKEKQLNVRLNAQEEFDKPKLAALISELHAKDESLVKTTGFSPKQVADLLYQNKYMSRKVSGVLAEKFLIPPFSVFDAKQGPWQDRKKAWLETLGNLAESREATLAKGERNVMMMYGSGTSSFDPVLSEIAYSWFLPEGGKILDPFAGSLGRGGVAALLNKPYTGIEIRKEQIDVNEKRLAELDTPPGLVSFIHGNAKDLGKLIPETDRYDLLFTCPPYYDLEIYSQQEGDLSAKQSYQEFMADYESIFDQAIARMNDNTFAILVLGDIRDDAGFYRGFVRDNIAIFEKRGYKLYNEIIYLQALATAPHRAERNMRKRKVVKVHQNILTLYKGAEDHLKNPILLDVHQKVIAFFKGDPSTIPDNFETPPPIQRDAIKVSHVNPDEEDLEDRS